MRIPLRDLTQQLHSKKEVRIVEELKLFAASKVSNGCTPWTRWVQTVRDWPLSKDPIF